jgi:hypothetical protein
MSADGHRTDGHLPEPASLAVAPVSTSMARHRAESPRDIRAALAKVIATRSIAVGSGA